MCQEKNGYENYQTSAVMDWLLEDADILLTLENRSLHVTNNAVFSWVVRKAVDNLSVLDDMPDTGLVADLLGHALDSVNWDQISDAIRERARNEML